MICWSFTKPSCRRYVMPTIFTFPFPLIRRRWFRTRCIPTIQACFRRWTMTWAASATRSTRIKIPRTSWIQVDLRVNVSMVAVVVSRPNIPKLVAPPKLDVLNALTNIQCTYQPGAFVVCLCMSWKSRQSQAKQRTLMCSERIPNGNRC